jgi:UDP-N-acetylmuramoyl-tripeptide--D-alanyl-D-alanine ligase
MQPINIIDLYKAGIIEIYWNPKLKEIGCNNIVSIDTRTIKNGNIYYAIKGENLDGHDFVLDAYKKGASICVVNEDWFNKNTNKLKKYAVFVTNDTTQSFGLLVNSLRKRFDIPFIAIGGSNGKTTAKEMIACVLSQKYNVLKTEGNLNNHIGVPLTLLRLEEKHQIAVIEIGTNHFNELKYLCKILEPDYGILTNIGREHLEFFKSIKGVAKAEGELLDYLKKTNQFAFINQDDEHIVSKSKGIKKKLTYGFNGKVAVKGKFLGLDKSALPTFEVTYKGVTTKIKLKIPGEHSVSNALAGAAIGFQFGLSGSQIKKGLESYQAYSKRMEVSHNNGITIINDCYNANPDSMIAAIKTLEQIKTKGRKIAVLGDMTEMGTTSKKGHQELGTLIGSSKIDCFLSIGKDMKYAFDKSDKLMENTIHFDSKEVLKEYLKFLVEKDDVVLIKGSRAMKMEDIITGLINK